MIQDLDDLKQRLEKIREIDLDARPEDPARFFYHTREWCAGYQALALDLLQQLR